MVLGFKENFVDKILDGSKIHTIRADEKNRWSPGSKIHFATGTRTKDYNCFKEGLCFSMETIFIHAEKMTIEVEGVKVNSLCMCKLAKNDGFESVKKLFEFFPEPFRGKIIHWTSGVYINAYEGSEGL